MTEPRDPVDDWLRADVDLMHAPPGAFERVHRRARRRRAVRTISAVAGAAVIIAAAATLPQIASALLPGHGGPERVAASSSTSHHPSTRPTSRPTRTPTPSASQPAPRQAGPPLSAGSGSPAAGFRPTSVTFIGQAGAVIGQAGLSCATGPCTSVAGTSNYGLSWFKVGAPPAGPADGASGVSQIRFLGWDNGWAYGPELYATHDGGATWTSISGLPGRVTDLATVGTRAFAVVSSCTGSGPDYAANCTSSALYSAQAGSNEWQPVPGASSGGQETPGGLQLTSAYGYLLTSGTVFAGPVTGGAWHSVSLASKTVPSCLVSASQPGPLLLAPGSGALYLVCDSSGSPATAHLALYVSRDGGRIWLNQGPVAAPGTATSLAVAPSAAGTLVLATSRGIYYSTDLVTWHSAGLTGQVPPGGFTFVGMTTGAEGVAVPAESSLQEVFITRDGGLTWQPSAIG